MGFCDVIGQSAPNGWDLVVAICLSSLISMVFIKQVAIESLRAYFNLWTGDVYSRVLPIAFLKGRKVSPRIEAFLGIIICSFRF